MRVFFVLLITVVTNLLAKECHPAQHESLSKGGKAALDTHLVQHQTVTELNGPKDTTIDLPLTKSFQFKADKSEITFKALVSDSRCPAGTNCIWEGEASIKLRYAAAGFDTSFVLSTLEDPYHHNSIRLRHFFVTLTGITPFPSGHTKINTADYKARLAIHNN